MARTKPPAKPEKRIGALAKRFELPGTRRAVDALLEVSAVPTRFVQFDWASRVGGWPLRRVAVVHGPSNEGKAQAVDEIVLTPSGWRKIGTLVVGDLVIGADGGPTRVTGVFPQGERDLLRVRFSDGSDAECCSEHLWVTRTSNEKSIAAYSRGPRPGRTRFPTGKLAEFVVRSTAEIACTLGDRHEIPMVGEVRYVEGGELPLDPYALGLLLGDGSFVGSCIRFSKPESDLQAAIVALLPERDLAVFERDDEMTLRFSGGSLRKIISELGLAGLRSHEKFVPDSYKRASAADRLALLQGLFDTDGTVTKDGGLVEYSSSSPRLAADVVEMARGLGAYVSTTLRSRPAYRYRGERRIGKPNWRVRVAFNDATVPVRSAKHLARWSGRTKLRQRRIVAIEPSRRAECVCIRVEALDHLYVTRDFVVTHNTAFALGLAASFVEADHYSDLVDAERTCTPTWIRSLVGATAERTEFTARKPSTYEACVDETRDLHQAIRDAKASGRLPEGTSLITIVDSLRKLSPEGLVKKISQHGAAGEKGSVDGMGGRAAQIKAALNASWLDELIPLIDDCGTSWLAIVRETDDAEADIWTKKAGNDYKIGGGKAVVYDSALRLRIQRAGWTYVEIDGKKVVVGERHEIEIAKTKIGGKEGKGSIAYFHTSNGTLCPEGFDRARDVVELALKFEVLELRGNRTAWPSREGESWASREKAIAALNDSTGDLETLEAEVRARFATREPDATPAPEEQA